MLCNKQQKEIRIFLNSTTTKPKQISLSRMHQNLSTNNLTTCLSSNKCCTTVSTMLQQGTLLSEHTLDTLSLTPLINASYIQLNSNEFLLGSLSRTLKQMKKPLKLYVLAMESHQQSCIVSSIDFDRSYEHFACVGLTKKI